MAGKVVHLIDEFNKTLDEKRDDKFPCKGKFNELREELGHLKSHISARKLPEEQFKELEDLLLKLREILKKCLEDNNGTCAGNVKPTCALRRLRRLIVKEAKAMGVGTGQEAGAAVAAGEAKDEEYPLSRWEIENYEFTSSFIEREKIYGLETQVEAIVDHLLKDDAASFSTVGIVGMEGSGKTALARKVFTDDRVLDKFALRLWVCVSPHDCQPKNVLKRALDSLGLDLGAVEKILEDRGKLEEVGVLLYLLYTELVDKSYLVVLDDVRPSVTHAAWYRGLDREPPAEEEWTHRLAYGLPKDGLDGGGAVIVTTRREDVARAMVGSRGFVHRMKPLQDELLEDGWQVFKKAFEAVMEMDPETDKDLGVFKRFIVEKCNGLPLALKIAGEGLAAKRKKEREDNPPAAHKQQEEGEDDQKEQPAVN